MKVRPAWLAGWLMVGLSLAAWGETQDSSLSVWKKGNETAQCAGETLLQESLVLAKAEAEYFRQQWMEMLQKQQALGVEALTADQKAMHEKLVQVTQELRRSERNRQAVEGALRRLMEAGKALNQTQGGEEERAAKRAGYEVALRQANEALEGRAAYPTTKTAADLSSVVVVNVDGASGILVLNAGRFQGVKVGMMFHLVRNDEVIGECQVMEVREYLSAALATGLQKEKSVQSGDKLLLAVAKK